MHQFVQSALEAANQGDKNKAIDLIKQVLAANPNDVDAWDGPRRDGRASNYIHVQPVEGGAISLAGFSEGDEVLYSFLTNWWDTYKHK